MLKSLKKAIYPLRSTIKTFIKTHIFVDRLFIIRQEFKRDNALYDLRHGYSLNKDSVVLDLGGYAGEWSERIWNKYECNIYIFEPVAVFIEGIEKKFKNNPKIHIFNFGLSDTNSKELISINGVASSTFVGKRDTVIELRDIKSVIEMLELRHIDLIKINIEGGEFKVLPRIIELGLLQQFDNLQIEFHHFYPEAERLRNDIQKALSKTHHLTYDYPFFFENWEKNNI